MITRSSSKPSVISNDDLLIEILLRLPLISLLMFKSVSKSLITSPYFTQRNNQNPSIDLPSGLFVKRPKGERKSQSKSTRSSTRLGFEYDFVSLDSRISSKISTNYTMCSKAPCGDIEIMQSCNGLLLCCIKSHKYYVYNPSIYMYTKLPKINPAMMDIHRFNMVGGIKLAFDPTKSPHYKVILAERFQFVNNGSYSIRINTYFTGTRNWSVCSSLFPFEYFLYFEDGIYWNGAIHWLNQCCDNMHFKLDIVDNPALTMQQLSIDLDGKKSWGAKLFESRGSLLLVCWDDADFNQLNVYEMTNAFSEWVVKYLVNLDDVMMPFPKTTWGIRYDVSCIVLGEREDDSFIVMQVCGKVLQYKTVQKTVYTLSDFGSDSLFESFPFISSIAAV